jgi:uncharacterized integral membrane protein
MLNLVSTPVGLMGGPAKQGQSNSGAGVFSVGTYLIVGILAVILLIFIFKNFDKIIDFIFKRHR